MKKQVYKSMMEKYARHIDERALAELSEKQAHVLDEIVLAFPVETEFLISVSARAGVYSGAFIGGLAVALTVFVCYLVELAVS